MRIVDAVKRIAPSANPAYLAGFDAGDSDLLRYGIVGPLRQAHFLGQWGGETGGGTILFESGNYTHASRIMQIFGAGRHSAAIQEDEAERIVAMPMPKREQYLFERVYGAGNPHMMSVLGNKPGDGWPFRGTGFLQSTGRGAAKKWGDKLGVDFVGNVALMVDPKYILAPALFEWQQGGLNKFADMNDLRHIRRMINGGYNGIDDCEEWFDKAYAVLRDEKQPAEAWKAANADPHLSAIQNSLNLLGYRPKLLTDGRFGPATKAAVKWFQEIAGVRVDGIPGPVTVTAINIRFASKRAA